MYKRVGSILALVFVLSLMGCAGSGEIVPLEASGVSDGAWYLGPVTPVVENASDYNTVEMMLNNAAYDGSPITAPGEYELSIVAAKGSDNTVTGTYSFLLLSDGPTVAISGVAQDGLYFDEVEPVPGNAGEFDRVAWRLNGEVFNGSVITGSGRHLLEAVGIKDGVPGASAQVEFDLFGQGPHSYTWDFDGPESAQGWGAGEEFADKYVFENGGIVASNVHPGNVGQYMTFNLGDGFTDFTLEGTITPLGFGSNAYDGIRFRIWFREDPWQFYNLHFRKDGGHGLWRVNPGTSDASVKKAGTGAAKIAVDTPFDFKIVVANNVLNLWVDGKLLSDDWPLTMPYAPGTIGFGSHVATMRVDRLTLILP